MKYCAALLTLAAACPAFAGTAFNGPDLSGHYECVGHDAHEGDYTGKVTLELIRAQSTGTNGAYRFLLEVPGYGSYPGEAAAHGTEMAIHFALTDPTTEDNGTGIAHFRKQPDGKWSFHKYYYEPAFKGGNHGTEDCRQR